MKLFILEFRSPLYHEDDKIIGAFSSEEKAKAEIQSQIAVDKAAYSRYPARHQQSDYYYNIIETELDEVVW